MTDEYALYLWRYRVHIDGADLGFVCEGGDFLVLCSSITHINIYQDEQAYDHTSLTRQY